MYEKEVQETLLEMLDQINMNPKMVNKVNLRGSEVAEILGCSQALLIYWRKEGLGPRYIKAPGTGPGGNQRCMYPKIEVAKWLAQNLVKTA